MKQGEELSLDFIEGNAQDFPFVVQVNQIGEQLGLKILTDVKLLLEFFREIADHVEAVESNRVLIGLKFGEAGV